MPAQRPEIIRTPFQPSINFRSSYPAALWHPPGSVRFLTERKMCLEAKKPSNGLEPSAINRRGLRGPLLSLPIGANTQFPIWLHRIITLEVDDKEMRAAHPRVHGEFGRDFRLLPRLQGRRTDDRLGGSAAFDGFDLWIHRQTKGLIPDISEVKTGCHKLLEADVAEVHEVAVYRQPGTSLVLTRHHLRGRSHEEIPGYQSNQYRHCEYSPNQEPCPARPRPRLRDWS